MLKKKISLKLLVVGGILNAIVHSMLFMPFSVVKKDKAASVQKIITQETIKGYPYPDLNSSIEENSTGGYRLFKEIGALNMYNKKIGRINYRITPSNLNSQNIFWMKNERLKNLLIQYPILYKADTLVLLKDSAQVSLNDNKKIFFINEYRALDTFRIYESACSAYVKRFTPNSWELIISCDAPSLYCLFQNLYPNWQLYIDGQKAPIIPCNISFMGFKLPVGVHTVSFQYEAVDIKIAFFISEIALIAILLLQIIFPKIKSGKDVSLPLH